MSATQRAVTLVTALAVAACGSVRGAPADGRYDGELCVATNANPPSCGAAEVSLTRSQARVQVSDIVYRLSLHTDRLDLVLMHGTMQIDGFSAPFVWEGRVLRFQDPDKPVFYRVRFADPPQAPTHPRGG